MTVMAHPSAEDLLQFVRGQLPDADAERVITHLESCSKCEAFVAAAPADSFVNQLRDAKPLPSTEEEILNRAGSISTQPEYATNPSNECGDLPAELLQHERYRFINKLGGGGMGVVYLAEQKMMKRKVAVKLMPQSLANNPAAVERFLNEIVACAKLEHQNVVRAYSAERFGPQILFEMEFVDGQDLADVVKLRGPLPVRYAMNYIKQAAVGLQQAHKEGLVHRDIKPRNIMLTKDGQIKVADFGLAKFQLESGEDADRRDLTGDDKMMGTPDYMAPEQSRNAKSADIRADIYSLGCTFYFLLTGKAPFRGRTMMDIVFAHTEQPVPDVRDERPTVPANVAELIKTMMAKKPADRLQSPKEVVEVLVEIERNWSMGEQSKSAQQPDPFEGLDYDTEIVTKVAKPQKPTSKLVIAALALMGVSCLVCLAAIVLLASGVIRLTTPKGTIELVGIEPDMDVMIDGEKMVVTWDSGKQKAEIQVSAGRPHKVEVLRNGSTLRAWDSIELVENGRKLFEVKLVAAKAAAKPAAKLDFQAEYSDVSQLKWTINGEELIQPSDETYGALLFGDRNWNNFDFTVEVKRVKGDYGVKLLFDYQDQNQHACSDLGCGSNKWHVGGSYVEGIFQKESEVSVQGELETGKWYRAKLRVRGNTATTYLDDKQILEYKLPRQIAGRIGLSTNMTSFHFRNISVKTPDGKVLLEGLPESPRVKIAGVAPKSKRFLADTVDFKRAEWKVDGNDLVQNAIHSRDLLLFDDPKQDEFDLSVDVQRMSGTMCAGLLYNYQDLQNYSWYSVGASDNKISYLAYSVNGKETYPDELKVPGSLEMKKWYKLELKVRRNMAMAYLDGKKILEHPQAGPHKGRIGIWTFNSTWRFRNIKLTDTQGKVLREGLPTLPMPIEQSQLAKSFNVESPHKSEGKWSIEGSELVQASDQATEFLVFGDPAWKNFNFSLEAKWKSGTYGFGLLFDYQDYMNYSAGAFAVRENSKHELCTHEDGIYQENRAALVNGNLEPDRWYRVEVRVRENIATLHLDGKQLCEYKLAEPLSGRLALATYESSCRFRNLTVQSADGKILLEGLPVAAPVNAVNAVAGLKRFPAEFVDLKRAYWKLNGDELLQGSRFSRDVLLFEDLKAEEFDFSAEVLRKSGVHAVGLVYNYQDLKNYSWYAIGSHANEWYVIGYNKNGETSVPDALSVKGTTALNQWYKMEIKVRKNLATAYLDGKKIVECPIDGGHKGRLGLWTFDSIYRFRNIKVADPQGKVLLEGLPALTKPTEEPRLGKSFNAESPTQPVGKWSIEGSELVQGSDESVELLVFGDPTWKNFDLSLETKRINGSEAISLLFDYQDLKNFSTMIFGGYANTWHEMGSYKNQHFQQDNAVSVEGQLDGDRWYRIELRVRGDKATGFLEGKQILEYNLPKPLGGKVGLSTHHSSFRFRNLTVKDDSGKVLLEGLPQSSLIRSTEPAGTVKRYPAEVVDFTKADWKIEGNELVQDSRFSREVLIFDDHKADEFDFSADVLRTYGEHAVGLVYNYRDLKNYNWYAISSHTNEWYVFGYIKTGEAKVPDEFSVRGTTALNQWYKMEVKIRKNIATAYLDGKKIVECPIEGGHKGRLGLCTFDSIYRFRNIKVTDPQGKLLLEGLPNLPPPRFPVTKLEVRETDWQIEGDTLVQKNVAGRGSLLFGEKNWENYEIQTEVKVLERGEIHGFGVYFRYQDYNENFSYNPGCLGGDWLVVHSWEPDAKTPQNMKGRQPAPLALRSPLKVDHWHQVRIVVGPETGEMYLDGVKLGTINTKLHPKGQIGLAAWAGVYAFRNISVKDLNGKVLVQGLPDLKNVTVDKRWLIK